jgi:hypothetical protein
MRRGPDSLPVFRCGLLLAAGAAACLVLGCAESMPPEHVAAISRVQGLGGRVLYSGGGYGVVLLNSRVQNDDLDLLKDIQNLNSLDLRGTEITDEGMAKLVPLKSLKTVKVTSSRITPDGIKMLKEARPDLVVSL